MCVCVCVCVYVLVYVLLCALLSDIEEEKFRNWHWLMKHWSERAGSTTILEHFISSRLCKCLTYGKSRPSTGMFFTLFTFGSCRKVQVYNSTYCLMLAQSAVCDLWHKGCGRVADTAQGLSTINRVWHDLPTLSGLKFFLSAACCLALFSATPFIITIKTVQCVPYRMLWRLHHLWNGWSLSCAHAKHFKCTSLHLYPTKEEVQIGLVNIKCFLLPVYAHLPFGIWRLPKFILVDTRHAYMYIAPFSTYL